MDTPDVPTKAALEKQYPPVMTPDGLKPRRRWGLSAFKRGWKAAHEGKSIDDCPYEDKRTKRGSVTFARGYINHWIEGFQAYHVENTDMVHELTTVSREEAPIASNNVEHCATCRGTGTIVVNSALGAFSVAEPCPECQ